MKLENILIAFDGSEPSVKAFDYAVDLAHRHAAALHVLAVAQISEVPSDVETEALIEQSRRHHVSLLDRGEVLGREADAAPHLHRDPWQ